MSDGSISEKRPPGARHGAWLAAALVLAGCAAQPPSAEREIRIGDNLRIYDMYDNSRPWGASYLVGPPMHHFGDQSRIDDLRAVPPQVSPADPATPPASSAIPPTLASKPLPAVP